MVNISYRVKYTDPTNENPVIYNYELRGEAVRMFRHLCQRECFHTCRISLMEVWSETGINTVMEAIFNQLHAF